VKITYLNRREGEKRFRGVIWGQKLTLNHPSLVDEGEEIRVSADGSQKREGKRGDGSASYINYLYISEKTVSLIW